MANFAFDATAVEAQAPATERTLLPEGFYNAIITATELKETKAGTGAYIRTEYTIIDGTHAKRKVWSNFNIRNSNPEAQRIGLSQLSSCCQAIGLPGISDTEQLHCRPLKIKVAVRQSEQYGDQNEVKGFAKSDLSVAAPTASVPTLPTAPKSSTPPWAAKK